MCIYKDNADTNFIDASDIDFQRKRKTEHNILPGKFELTGIPPALREETLNSSKVLKLKELSFCDTVHIKHAKDTPKARMERPKTAYKQLMIQPRNKDAQIKNDGDELKMTQLNIKLERVCSEHKATAGALKGNMTTQKGVSNMNMMPANGVVLSLAPQKDSEIALENQLIDEEIKAQQSHKMMKRARHESTALNKSLQQVLSVKMFSTTASHRRHLLHPHPLQGRQEPDHL